MGGGNEGESFADLFENICDGNPSINGTRKKTKDEEIKSCKPVLVLSNNTPKGKKVDLRLNVREFPDTRITSSPTVRAKSL